MSKDWLSIMAEPLDAGAAINFVTEAGAGAIDVFLGTTRAEKSADGVDLLALDYEAYSDMAQKQLEELAATVREKWPVLAVAILHRVGRVKVGEPSVVIAVSTPHRAESFEACKWLIDTLKASVTIWKKEVWDDGSTSWVGATA